MQMRRLSGVHWRQAQVLDTALTKAMESLRAIRTRKIWPLASPRVLPKSLPNP
jgi:hypothetical protein